MDVEGLLSPFGRTFNSIAHAMSQGYVTTDGINDVVSAMSSGVVLGQENHYGRLPTPSIPKLQRLREVTGESLTGDLLGLTPGVDTGGV